MWAWHLLPPMEPAGRQWPALTVPSHSQISPLARLPWWRPCCTSKTARTRRWSSWLTFRRRRATSKSLWTQPTAAPTTKVRHAWSREAGRTLPCHVDHCCWPFPVPFFRPDCSSHRHREEEHLLREAAGQQRGRRPRQSLRDLLPASRRTKLLFWWVYILVRRRRLPAGFHVEAHVSFHPAWWTAPLRVWLSSWISIPLTHGAHYCKVLRDGCWFTAPFNNTSTSCWHVKLHHAFSMDELLQSQKERWCFKRLISETYCGNSSV